MEATCFSDTMMYTYKPTYSDTHILQRGESRNLYIMLFPVLSSCELHCSAKGAPLLQGNF